MAIVIKGLSGPAFLKLLGIPQEQTDWLDFAGFTVTVYAGEVKFKNAEVDASIPVKSEILIALQAGNASDLAIKTLRMTVKQAIKQLQTKLGHPGIVVGLDLAKTDSLSVPVVAHPSQGSPPEPITVTATAATPLPSMSATGVMGLLAKNKPFKPAEVSPPAPIKDPAPEVPPSNSTLPEQTGPIQLQKTWQEFPVSKLKTAEPVALLHAKALYQPVRGSSPGSRYFVVGANAELRIAARFKEHSLSVRIEGPQFFKNKSRLVACGFTTVNTSYASMHLHVDDTVIANKAMGAILMGLGVKLDTPMPDLSLIQNKGA